LGQHLHTDRDVEGADLAIFTRHLVNDVIGSDVSSTGLIENHAGWGIDREHPATRSVVSVPTLTVSVPDFGGSITRTVAVSLS
jgi:hypothetical protein